MTRGHGGMGGEDHLPWNLAGGGVEVDASFHHAVANGLEDGEAAVTLVEMENSGRDAHGFEGAEATNAEQQLLTDARARVAAIESGGGIEVFRGVAGNVGVEQEQVDPADFDPPDLGANRTAAGFDLHHHGLPVYSNRRLHRQLIHIGLEILLALPSSLVETLQEVALPVEQADADERNIQVRCAR